MNAFFLFFTLSGCNIETTEEETKYDGQEYTISCTDLQNILVKYKPLTHGQYENTKHKQARHI